MSRGTTWVTGVEDLVLSMMTYCVPCFFAHHSCRVSVNDGNGSNALEDQSGRMALIL